MTARPRTGLWCTALLQHGCFVCQTSPGIGVVAASQHQGIRWAHSKSKNIDRTLQIPFPHVENIRVVQERLRAAGVSFPRDGVPKINLSENDMIPTRRPSTFSVAAYPRHRVTDRAMEYFTKPTPLTGRVSARLLERNRTEPLWLSTFTKRNKHDARILNCAKSVTERRLSSAFREALRMHGYDRHGRRIQKSNGKPEQLYGQVSLGAMVADAIKTDRSAVIAYYHAVIKQLEPAIGCAAGDMPPMKLSNNSVGKVNRGLTKPIRCPQKDALG